MKNPLFPDQVTYLFWKTSLGWADSLADQTFYIYIHTHQLPHPPDPLYTHISAATPTRPSIYTHISCCTHRTQQLDWDIHFHSTIYTPPCVLPLGTPRATRLALTGPKHAGCTLLSSARETVIVWDRNFAGENLRSSLVPRLLPPNFQLCTRRMREPGKTYHESDVVGGTNLCQMNQNQVSSTHYVTHVVSLTRLPRFSCTILKSVGRSLALGTRLSTCMIIFKASSSPGDDFFWFHQCPRNQGEETQWTSTHE